MRLSSLGKGGYAKVLIFTCTYVTDPDVIWSWNMVTTEEV